MSYLVTLLLLLLCYTKSTHQKELHFVIYCQTEHHDLPFIAEDIFKELDTTGDVSRHYRQFNHSEELAEFQESFCSQLDPTRFNIILDLVWNTNPRIRQLANALEVPYFKLDPTIYPLMDPVVKFIQARNGTESVFILPEKELVDQAMYGLLENSDLRMIVVNRLDRKIAQKLAKKRPIPQHNTIIASTEVMNDIFQQAIDNDLIKFEDRWNLMFLDDHQDRFKFHASHPGVSKVILEKSFYCQWFPEMRGKDCKWPEKEVLDHLPLFLRTVLSDLSKFYKTTSYPAPITSLCDDPFNVYPAETNFSTMKSELEYFEHLLSHPVLFIDLHNQIKFKLDASLFQSHPQLVETQLIGQYSSQMSGQQISTYVDLQKPRRYFRIGTAVALPWSTYKLHPVTGEPLRTDAGEPIWEGYCIDLIHRLSQVMDFEYDIIEPESKTLGEKIDGRYNGAVGDLVSGETDIIVAALVTTAEREEVIDFVAPIFEETGISIVIRKPVRTTSLFKFMSVLRLEVWISIVISLIISALLIWFLDKYSPYSGQNRKYPFECRYFSLKESFWFTLTSYTPQGGGELPKALSGRTVVATYWLFVVLILATFTANLASFLTVERMNTPVSSLEQLGKQSRINYTVVEGSETHKYFINMKFAEDFLYDTWKNASLASTWDQEKYRVWDYPIQEQYGLMLRAINSSGPVRDAKEGFKNVIDHLNADYAFIHDSQEIRYEMARNCELTEIGEVFGKRPYGLAIQQGNSLLQDELTKAILQLQKERFFDDLNDKYWNASIGNCESDENEGMSLESLGGVFIVTIFGLGIAVVALIVEWVYYWKKASEAKGMNEVEAANGGQGEENHEEGFRGALRRRSNMVGVGGEVEPGNAFGVHKMSVSIVEDQNEVFD